MPNKRRIRILLALITLCFLLLNLKFMYLQLFLHNRYYKEAASQRSMSIKICNNRGIIYDRNMIPLVNNNLVKYVIVFPELIINKSETEILLQKISQDKSIKEKLSLRNPFVLKVLEKNIGQDLMENLNKNAIFVMDNFERYGSKNFARHLIGYTAPGDEHGRAGIEKAYDKFLFSMRGKYVGSITDALHHSITGLGTRFIDEQDYNGELDVKLTLDFHIQQIVERYMDQNKISGAVVALRISDGDIVAVGSRPQFEQDNISKYLNSEGNELVNKALSAFNIGSVFKIVVAAATLEDGLSSLSDTFYCNGSKEVEKRLFRCSASHELIDLQKAFSVSCNSAFISLGLKVGKEKVLNMAKKFGFGEYTGLSELGISESSGNLSETKYNSKKEVANIAIGQGDIMVTPLQAASLIATIANDGIKTSINLVDSVIDSDGKIVKKIKTLNKKRVITSDTAARLKLMMEEVTEAGTGKKANIPTFGGSAGKTGTAQTGWVQGRQTKVHGWFAGYFPRKNPQYALVVFVDNGQSGSEVAAPIFGQIATEIMKLGKR